MNHTARSGSDLPTGTIDSISSADGLNRLNRLDGLDGLDRLDGRDGFDGLDWIEVPLDSPADRSSAVNPFTGRHHRLAQLSVANHRPASRHGGVADLLREVAQRLDELEDEAVVHDITFGGPARRGAADIEPADARMTVYYEN
jgi:hypothetical protein